MGEKGLDISLALGWNERYDHKVAIGIIKFARMREDWRLFDNEWLFQTNRPGERRTDGIIARITNRDDLERIKSYNVPVVDVANSYDDANLPSAVNDDALTGRLAGQHLMEKGFVNLAYIGIDEVSWSLKRMQGMRDLLRETGGGELQHLSVAVSWLKRKHTLADIVKWLKKLPLPCGIMAANDILGYWVTMAASTAGLAVPDQVAVVGVDNEDVYCELARPTLTSISCDCERIGMEAAQLLSQILNNEDPLRQVVVPPLGIHPRESTAVALGEDRMVREARRFIRANAGKGINVGDVAAAFPLSRRALEKRFKNAVGTTIHDEIARTRLDKARTLLAAGKTAAEAGYESGFSTIQHFYHAFKKHCDMTPMEYASENKTAE